MGLTEVAVKESRDRVKPAIENAGFDFPARRITADLVPSDINSVRSAVSPFAGFRVGASRCGSMRVKARKARSPSARWSTLG